MLNARCRHRCLSQCPKRKARRTARHRFPLHRCKNCQNHLGKRPEQIRHMLVLCRHIFLRGRNNAPRRRLARPLGNVHRAPVLSRQSRPLRAHVRPGQLRPRRLGARRALCLAQLRRDSRKRLSRPQLRRKETLAWRARRRAHSLPQSRGVAPRQKNLNGMETRI